MLKDFKHIAFDVDGTLTKGNIWQRLHTFAGISPSDDEKWFEQYAHGEISFDQWNSLIIACYQKSRHTKKELEQIMLKFELIEGVEELFDMLRNKISISLVSSGIDFYVRGVAQKLQIPKWHSNYTFDYDDKGILKNITRISEESEAKVIAIKETCQKQKIKPEEILFVGDSSNDLDAFLFTGRGVLIGQGNEKLRQVCWKQIGSINQLLPLLL